MLVFEIALCENYEHFQIIVYWDTVTSDCSTQFFDTCMNEILVNLHFPTILIQSVFNQWTLMFKQTQSENGKVCFLIVFKCIEYI